MITTRDTCQYIGATEGSAYKPTCCKAAVQGRSYCAEHLGLVYQLGSAVRRKKDARRAQAVWDIESEFNAVVQELVDEGYDLNDERWDVKEEVEEE